MRKAKRHPISGASTAGSSRNDGGCRTHGSAEPEAAVDDEIGPTAVARGDQFLDRRIDGGVFPADAGAGQEPKQRKAPQIPGQRGGCGSDQIEREE
jgi:hypothetical protein